MIMMNWKSFDIEKVRKTAAPKLLIETRIALIKMMTVAIVLLAVLPSVFSDSAQCPGNTRAVDGYPNKCYLYSYQDQGMDWDAQNSYCHRAKV